MRGMIVKGNQWGNPRKQVEAIERGKDSNLEKKPFSPMFVGSNGRSFRLKAQSPGTMTGDSGITSPSQQPGSGARGTMITSTPIYYDPRFYTLDRFYYPRTKEQALSIWQMLYNRDHVCGVATDLYCSPKGENIIVNSGTCEIQNIVPGTRIVANGAYEKVEECFERPFEGDLFSVEGIGSMPFRITENHSVFVNEGEWVKSTDPNKGRWKLTPRETVFKPVQELRKEMDFLVIPKLKESIKEYTVDLLDLVQDENRVGINKFDGEDYIHLLNTGKRLRETKIWAKRFIKFDERVCELMGWFVSEGHIPPLGRGRTDVQFNFGKKNFLQAYRVTELLDEVFGFREPDKKIKSVRLWKSGRKYRISLVSKFAHRFFAHFCGDLGSVHKKIPQPIMEGPREWAKAFLKGYLWGDGCLFAKCHDVRACTVSLSLAYQIQLLATKCDCFFRLHRRRFAPYHKNYVYSLDCTKKQTYPNIFDWDAPGGKRHENYIRDMGDHFLVPIRNIKKDHYKGSVYGFRTPSKTYCVPAVLHNSDLPWSPFDLTGIEDKKILQFYQDMFTEINLQSHMPDMTREYLKSGMAIPHLIFNGRKGYWSNLFFHNPMFIRVTPVPIPGADPLLDMKPSPDLREFAVLRDPRAMTMKQMLPDVFIQRLMAGLPIPLDPVNCTYLARKSAPYDSEGTSIYSRIYRAQMIEDFLANATIAVAQRHANPLRIFKLGDRETGWLPEKEDEESLAEMLAACETDPLGAIIFHYGLEVDYVGVQERSMSITREWDWIERVKFLALGISKSFLLGETSFAAAVAGLQTMAERLLALRQKFENQWIYPKVIKNVAIMNQFYTRKTAELSHRIRTTARTEANLVMPKLKWRKTLEPSQDTELVRIWKDMKEMGITSNRTIAVGAGLDLDTERKNIKEEADYERQMKQENPELYATMMTARKKKAHVAKTNGKNRYHAPSHLLESKIWDQDGKYGSLDYEDVEPIVDLLRNGSTDDTEWKDIEPDWERVKEELEARGYDDQQMAQVEEVMREEGLTAENATQAREMSKAESQMAATALRQEPGLAGKKYLAGS